MERNAVLAAALLLAASPGVAARTLSVDAEQVNVREGPGVGYDALYRAWRHTPFRVLERDGDWYRVSDFEGLEGYVHASLLAQAPTVLVTSLRANVRSGPGTEHGVAWELERGYALLVKERQGNWLRVTDSEDLEGWIHVSVVWGIEDEGDAETGV